MSASMRGLRIVVSAGPTFEDIDPVRFLGNRSSGKMGFALARVARQMGAQVVVVAGPTSASPPAEVEVLQVQTAEQMLEAALSRVGRADLVIGAAAVAEEDDARLVLSDPVEDLCTIPVRQN